MYGHPLRSLSEPRLQFTATMISRMEYTLNKSDGISLGWPMVERGQAHRGRRVVVAVAASSWANSKVVRPSVWPSRATIRSRNSPQTLGPEKKWNFLRCLGGKWTSLKQTRLPGL